MITNLILDCSSTTNFPLLTRSLPPLLYLKSSFTIITNMVAKVSQTPKAVRTKAADKELNQEFPVECQKGKKIDNRFRKEVCQEIMMRFNKKMGDKMRSVK